MFLSAALGGGFVGTVREDSPIFDQKNDQSVRSFFHFHSAQGLGNGRLGSLVLLRDADAVSIVPHVHEHGDRKTPAAFMVSQNRTDVHRSSSDGNFIAPCGESRFSLHHCSIGIAWMLPTEQPRHLTARGADVCRAVELGHVIHPFAVIGQKPRGEMTAHLSSRRGGFAFDVGIGV